MAIAPSRIEAAEDRRCERERGLKMRTAPASGLLSNMRPT